MKTFDSLLKTATIAAFGIVLIMAASSVSAQNKGKHGNNNGNHNSRKEWAEDNHNNRNKDKHDYSSDEREYKYEHGWNNYSQEIYRYDYPNHLHNNRAPWGHHKPLVINHSHGKVYLYGGHYYEYLPSRGYVMINIPVNYVFNEIPIGCRKVWIAGQYYYKYEELFFRPSIHGYVMISNPFEINFTARF